MEDVAAIERATGLYLLFLTGINTTVIIYSVLMAAQLFYYHEIFRN